MGLLDHLSELLRSLVRCCLAVMVGFIACWAVVDPIFDALVAPLLSVLPDGSHAIYTTLPEGFFTRMHIAFVAGVFVSSPAIFYQVWAFIAPGLYEEEKRSIIPVAGDVGLFLYQRRRLLLLCGFSQRICLLHELRHRHHRGYAQDQRLSELCAQAYSCLWPCV